MAKHLLFDPCYPPKKVVKRATSYVFCFPHDLQQSNGAYKRLTQIGGITSETRKTAEYVEREYDNAWDMNVAMNTQKRDEQICSPPQGLGLVG